MPAIDGLISGLDTTSIIEQLVQINRIPINKLQEKIDVKTEQIDTLSLFTTQLLDLKFKAFDLTKSSTYRQNDVSSSNESILGVTGQPSDSTGSFDFRVARLAAAAQSVSDGLANRDTATLGAGSFTIEMGGGFVDISTEVSRLNGGTGFERGSISITDGAGTNKNIDLSLAVTVQDILNSINETSGLQVTASLGGDSIILTDTSGSSSVAVAEVDGGQTATSLGLLKTHSGGVITGDSVNNISLTTSIGNLNDGNGVRTLPGEEDLTFTTSAGGSFNVNLGTVSTVGDVINAINNDADNAGKITASLDSAGKSLRLVDNTTEAGGAFTVTAFTGAYGTKSGALVDLGLESVSPESSGTGAVDVADGTIISGKRLVGTLNSMLTRTLNGGRRADGSGGGVSDGGITITDRQGASATLDLSSRKATTVSVDPNIGDNTITLTDTTAAGFEIGNSFRITDGTNTEYRVVTSVNRATGVVGFADALSLDFAAGSSVYASNESLGDMVNAISNNTTVNVTATFNKELNGLKIVDNTVGIATSELSVVEAGSTAAADLGIKTGVTGAQTVSAGGSTTTLTSATLAGLGLSDDQLNGLELLFTAGANAGQKRTISDFDATTGVVDFDSAFASAIGGGDTFTITGIDSDQFNGFDLNPKYINENTKLADMNNGEGVFSGKFQVTDRNNKIFQVNITSAVDLEDVIFQFNSTALAATSDARLAINNQGNGLLVTSPTGAGSLVIQDLNGGASAKDLNIVANTTSDSYDGSFQSTITLTGTETLNDLKDTINNLSLPLRATIINDGSAINPYRLNLISDISGQKGRLLVDDFDDSFNFATTTKAQDSALLFGGTTPGSSPVLVTDNDNVISDLVPGLTLDLKKVSSEAVTVNITRNTNKIVDTIDEFVTDFNAAIEEIHFLSDYNITAEGEKVESDDPRKAILAGNYAMRNVEADLFRVVNSTIKEITGTFNRLSTVGVSVKSDGLGIELDKGKLTTALNDNYNDVVNLLDLGGNISNTTQLSSLRGGSGIRLSTGNDIRINLRDGSNFEVNLSGLTSVADVVTAINFHSSNPGTLVAALKADGTGIQITDSTVGASDLVITNINGSSAGTDLGIAQTGLTSGSDKLIKGFTLKDRGVFSVFNSVLSKIVDTDGTLDHQSDTFNTLIDDYNDRIKTIEDRVANEQQRLFTQFANLENVLSGLQNQSSFLTSLLPR